MLSDINEVAALMGGRQGSSEAGVPMTCFQLRVSPSACTCGCLVGVHASAFPVFQSKLFFFFFLPFKEENWDVFLMASDTERVQKEV